MAPIPPLAAKACRIFSTGFAAGATADDFCRDGGTVFPIIGFSPPIGSMIRDPASRLHRGVGFVLCTAIQHRSPREACSADEILVRMILALTIGYLHFGRG